MRPDARSADGDDLLATHRHPPLHQTNDCDGNCHRSSDDRAGAGGPHRTSCNSPLRHRPATEPRTDDWWRLVWSALTTPCAAQQGHVHHQPRWHPVRRRRHPCHAPKFFPSPPAPRRARRQGQRPAIRHLLKLPPAALQLTLVPAGSRAQARCPCCGQRRSRSCGHQHRHHPAMPAPSHRRALPRPSYRLRGGRTAAKVGLLWEQGEARRNEGAGRRAHNLPHGKKATARCSAAAAAAASVATPATTHGHYRYRGHPEIDPPKLASGHQSR